MSSTATLVKKLTGFTGDARLYKVDPPMPCPDWTADDGAEVETTDFVIVSATVAPFSGPETYIFRATPDGEVVGYGEMDGSYRGGLDHDEALRNAGYTVGGEAR